MDTPKSDPKVLLDHWMEWEAGETTPGAVMKNVKIGGLAELLKDLAAEE